MENKDKLYEQFSDATQKAEDKAFARMDAVWNRVEEKLDRKQERHMATRWKYTGVAAMLLLFITIGFFTLRDTTVTAPNGVPQKTVTVTDKSRPDTDSEQNRVKTHQIKTIEAPQPAKGYVVVETPVNERAQPTADKADATWADTAPAETAPGNAGDPIVFVGTITDGTGKSVAGANVIVNGRVTKTTTGPDGKYVLRAKVGDSIKVAVPGLQTSALVASYANNNRNMAIANGLVSAEPLHKMNVEVQSKVIQDPFFTPAVTYSGIVISTDDGLPLPGASVMVKGSTNATQTDIDGKYTITAQPGAILVISYIGMKEQLVSLTDTTTQNVALNNDNNTLEEVVVVGYGTSKKKDVTSAVSTVTPKDMSRKERKQKEKEEKQQQSFGLAYQGPPVSISKGTVIASNKDEEQESVVYYSPNAPVTQSKSANSPKYYALSGTLALPSKNSEQITGDIDKDGVADKNGQATKAPLATFDQMLKGQAAGVAITQGNGQPGAAMTVRIHGSTSIPAGQDPLYIVNGIPVSAEAFAKIDAKKIQSVNVLKDASATGIYGNRGANGVIIITTKKLSRKERRALKNEWNGQTTPAPETTAPAKPEPNDKVEVDQESYEAFEENKFENPATTPLSTFSIDVDNASYTNVRRFLNNGQTVPKDAVRVEEMVNFFKYQYPQPAGKDPFAISTEYSECPWNPKHKLLKIGLKGKEVATQDLPASNFVYLIDVSGSMNEPDKLPLLKESMKLLVKQMRSQDRIAIVVYAGAAGLVLPSTSGLDKSIIMAALDNLSAGGSTAGGAGIELAYKTAQDNFIKGGNNRVVLATDGDFNVGASSDGDMKTLIEQKRQGGVFLTCLGYGMGNYKDSKLETLADKGNGNYAYIDTMQEADRFLDKEFKGSMYAIAKDVKIQIEFNPTHVQSYRLIGYENRKLRDEDFANDAIDAGELGSGHTVTALYEIIPVGVQSNYFTVAPNLKYSTPQQSNNSYSSELATIKFRYKKPDGDKSTEMVQIIPDVAVAIDNASADYKFAAAVAWFGLKLRDSKLISDKTEEHIIKLAKDSVVTDPEGYRAEFIRLLGRVE